MAVSDFAVAGRSACSNQAHIVAGGHEQRIDGVASMAEKEVPVQPPIGLHVADGGLDG